MKKNRIDKTILINSLISLAAIFISSFLSFQFGKSAELETREYQKNKEALLEVLENVQHYNNYYTVDWDKISKKRIEPYNCIAPSKSIKIHELEIEKEFETPNTCAVGDNLASAEFIFRELTTKARVLGSNEIKDVLHNTEEGFSEVYNLYVTEDYYSRLFKDSYNQVMGAKFINLEKVFSKELQ